MSKGPSQEPTPDHAAATEWCGTVADETGSKYTGTVTWCLHYTFMKGEKWRDGLIFEDTEPVPGRLKQLGGS